MRLPLRIGLTLRAAKVLLAGFAVSIAARRLRRRQRPRADKSGRDRLDRRGEGRSAPAAHRLGQHALCRQGAEAGGRACAIRFRQSVGLARAERHQGHAGGRASGGAERDPGRRRADHRAALRARSRCRRSDSAPVEHSDDRLFQRREGRRRRRLSFELPRRTRRAAHRFLRRLPRQTQFRAADPAVALRQAGRGSVCAQHRAERGAGRGARHLPAERRQRHARPGAAGGKRHEGRAGRCAVLARGARGPPIARAAACLERRHQQRPAVPRHRAMGLSLDRQGDGSGRRLVPGTRPERLERFRRQIRQDLWLDPAAHRKPRL